MSPLHGPPNSSLASLSLVVRRDADEDVRVPMVRQTPAWHPYPSWYAEIRTRTSTFPWTAKLQLGIPIPCGTPRCGRGRPRSHGPPSSSLASLSLVVRRDADEDVRVPTDRRAPAWHPYPLWYAEMRTRTSAFPRTAKLQLGIPIPCGTPRCGRGRPRSHGPPSSSSASLSLVVRRHPCLHPHSE